MLYIIPLFYKNQVQFNQFQKKSALVSFPKTDFSVFVYIPLFFFAFFALFRQFANNRQASKKCNQVWKHH